MTESEEVYLPEENTGMELSGEAVTQVERMLGDKSALDEAGFRKAEEEDLPEDVFLTGNKVYIQEYEIPYAEGDNPLDPQVETASFYSVATTDAHYFIAENEVSRHLPEVSSDLYQPPR